MNAFPSPELRNKILNEAVRRVLLGEAIEHIDFFQQNSDREVCARVRFPDHESATVSLQLTSDGDYFAVASCVTQVRNSFPHTWAHHWFNDCGCAIN